MITINTKNYNTAGSFVFYDKDMLSPPAEYKNIERRVNRTKTLDGGVYISDNGYAVGDKTLIITLNQPDKDLIASLETIFSTNSEYITSTDIGVYLSVLKDVKYSGGNATITFLIKEEA